MQKRKRRSTAASSAASRKAWRTRKRMTLAELFHAIDEIDRLYNVIDERERRMPTINQLPMVEWK